MLCPRQLSPLLAERAYAPIPFSYVYMYRLQLLAAYYSSVFQQKKMTKGRRREERGARSMKSFISAPGSSSASK
ncbi:uncharacterized protein SCHCODRAFT_01301838 [Schizophyllum commune H4-8]|uniref:uncharacterized protein n=1 Tax=Schizophyllum commune (strain H4-8 / FGSC 9210) TaxID=578458 RepID=UPI002160EC5C|nr:uncharacterized protein SCHCODRAFT_01301838 [Schizophyllum commune H4-8]KAI5892468.1 hypothetical protein SCHCODRAFT_01301838 [Schizophyllum commune H4-8]